MGSDEASCERDSAFLPSSEQRQALVRIRDGVIADLELAEAHLCIILSEARACSGNVELLEALWEGLRGSLESATGSLRSVSHRFRPIDFAAEEPAKAVEPSPGVLH